MLGICSELRYRLCDQDIEPIETFRLMGIHVIVGLGENFIGGERRGVSEDG